MNETPSAQRIHIGIFGRRNAGKSSLINAITNQETAIVSKIKGTTTDPVSKAMELLPLGPVVLIDTPGLDDEGELGALRVEKAKDVLRRIDLALLVTDAATGMGREERLLEQELKGRQVPYLIVYNKCDLQKKDLETEREICASALTGEGISKLKERLAGLLPERGKKWLAGDLLEPGDLAVLVIPIDKAAPKGRLILPQQQTIRDILDRGAFCLTVRDRELKAALAGLGKKPKLVITDSQVFAKADRDTPQDVWLTSFSILQARYKGNLFQAVEGVKALERLEQGDRVLICEGCTHHRQCDDIGTVKLPRWIEEYTGKRLDFHFTSGLGYEEELQAYKLIVHCGGCMLNEREMQYRLKQAALAGVPMTNYGILIAHLHGILKRSLEPFSEAARLLAEKEG